jgi:hypothetical protein
MRCKVKRGEKVGANQDGEGAPRGERVSDSSFQERFLDCVSRRFAQTQKRGTLRSE